MTRQALKSELLHPGMRVGLFGGSFDPPHPGHLHVARTALRRLQLDRVWWLVSPQNPLKRHQPGDFGRRMAAVEALASEPRMVVSDIEARLGINRTVDLMRMLKRRHPSVRFVWIMGADNLASIHRWGHWREIFASYPIAVVSRPTDAPSVQGSPRRPRSTPATRIAEDQARILADLDAPAWTYLTEPYHPHSSTALRQGR